MAHKVRRDGRDGRDLEMDLCVKRTAQHRYCCMRIKMGMLLSAAGDFGDDIYCWISFLNLQPWARGAWRNPMIKRAGISFVPGNLGNHRGSCMYSIGNVRFGFARAAVSGELTIVN